LCGTAKVNVRIPYGSATNLRGITYAAKHEITPVATSADSTNPPEAPQCIVIASPCSLGIVPTGPDVTIDPRSRHSFSLRNATAHETAFIMFAHMSGTKKAEWLAQQFEWKFNRPTSELIEIVEFLNIICAGDK
jgi:hypothetical protein